MASRAGAMSGCLLAILFVQCSARIGMRGSSKTESISIEKVESSLLSELAGALGQHSGDRILRIEEQMRPMYNALPKNSNGTLTDAVVRYGLHRFFVQQHGWHVKGLEPGGHSRNDTSATDMLKDRVPSHVLALVHKHLEGRGFGLHELAVLAATLDDLIHSESMERLSKAFEAHGVPVQGTCNRAMCDIIIQTYMVFYILPNEKIMKLSSNQLQRLLPKIPKAYPGWDDTMLWVRDLITTMEWNDRMERNPFKTDDEDEMDFASVARIVEEVGGQFGRFQDLECRTMKWTLLDMEEADSGRVLLSSFYGNTLNGGTQQFKESEVYLRDTGVLDETTRRRSVIIPNYINGRSNCLAASSFYSVCCIDECEALMVHLENQIASPLGTPTEIADMVAIMHSDTIDAPRNLSSSLLSRLNGIAAMHGGKVPLHGRLFAQWMHHAYPRECPYPQSAGSSSIPMTPAEWRQATNNTQTVASQEDMEAHVNATENDSGEEEGVAELPWSEEEELVMALEPAATGSWWLTSLLRNLACVAVLIAAAISLMQTSRNALCELPLHIKDTTSFKVGKTHYV